jgi:hypothetical protein
MQDISEVRLQNQRVTSTPDNRSAPSGDGQVHASRAAVLDDSHGRWCRRCNQSMQRSGEIGSIL